MYKSIKKLGVTSQWPGTNNAYLVEVTFDHKPDVVHKTTILKEEFEMENFMISVLNKKLSKKELEQFKDILEDYALMNYSRGSDSVFED